MIVSNDGTDTSTGRAGRWPPGASRNVIWPLPSLATPVTRNDVDEESVILSRIAEDEDEDEVDAEDETKRTR